LPAGQLRRRLDDARREMEKAITGEDYEAAARLRDEIAGLEQQLANS
jgi:protein-arginine kinase activator protein McsA